MDLRGLILIIFIMLMFIWLTFWTYDILYRTPLRHRGLEPHHRNTIYSYLGVLATQCFLLPWICLGLWYVAVAQACGRYPPGPYLEAFCLHPQSSLGNGTPWYLDLWNAGNEHSSITFSHSTETILLSNLAINEARSALQQQATRLKDTTPEIIGTDDLFSSLGMLQATTIPIQVLYTPAYCPGSDQVIDIVSDLAPQLDTFANKFCLEKDIMTHELRAFVESYATLATFSHFEDLTLPSMFLLPGLHLIRLISQHSSWLWLPEPKLYTFQVMAEIQFRKEQLRYELKSVLDRIDADFPATQLFQNSRSQSRCIEAAIAKITIHQHMVREVIGKSDSPLWQWNRGSEETAELERYHKLGECVRGRLLIVRDAMDEYGVHCRRLRSNLDDFRQIFDRIPLVRPPARSSSAVPDPLHAHVRNTSLLSHGQSSRIHGDGDSSKFTPTTSPSRVFLYDPNSIDDTRLSSLRSEVAQLCKAGTDIMMGSDDLYSICVIYDLIATTPELDDDPLSSFQTSWVVAREEAIHRWQEERGLDLYTVLNLFVKAYRDYKHGIPLPEFF